ncbi:amidohydrolase [Sporolactobacillus laevolacticus]|uniref:Amidohydrolase n=1 Tax=Sporolactobacillus laevolacticus DSM 442 TaxID=1395513 RepID=V6J588_9BACL|nr:amidohydrolase [Sporolactobacillus laevolacticus]EST11884.1 amidohydrolase [Sporolactobacillus laevolacticus DSM 442]
MKLWENGTFYTMNKQGESASCVLTDKGRIVALDEQARNLAQTSQAETIDLQNGVVFPGFVDSHLHLLWYGQALDRLNLYGYPSKQACLEAIAERAKRLTDGQWLFVEGYDDNNLSDSKQLLTRWDLDKISDTHPILVRRIDYHSVSVNTPFIKEIGLKHGQVFEGGGMIDLNDEGEPTGVLRDEASMLAIERFPTESQEELERLIKLAIHVLWKKGLVGAHSEDLHYFNGLVGTVKAYRNVLSQKIPFRAHLLVHHKELSAYLKAPEAITHADAFVELGAMKIFYDGTVGSHTALMSQPYMGEPGNYGLKFHSDEEFEKLVQQARAAKLPVAIHIIGDRAFQNVIRVLKKYPPLPGQKDRMIHTPWLHPNMLEEAKGMPLIFDIQPQFMSSDMPWAFDVLGPSFPPLAFAWKSIQDYGFTIAGGSDAPIEIPNPFHAIHAAVTRTCNSDLNGKQYFPEERLNVFEAIGLYTSGSAAACNHSDTRGTINVGNVADFTVLDKDPFHIDPADLRKITVQKTIVDERVVFQK